MTIRIDVVKVISLPFALATLVLFCRLYTRFIIVRNAGVDDLCVTLAWALSGALFGLFYKLRNLGMGQHITEILIIQLLQDIPDLLKILWISTFLRVFSMALTKISIFIQYLRVFTGRTRKAAWCGIALVTVNTIWFFFIIIFFCSPVRKFWTPEIEGRCLNIELVSLVYGTANITTSLITIIVPIPAVLALKMERKAKIAVIILFSLGVFDIILAIFQLVSLTKLTKAKDVTFYLQPVCIWSFLETAVAIICASIPGLRPLATKFWTGFSTVASSSLSQTQRVRDSLRLSSKGSGFIISTPVTTDISRRDSHV